MTIEVEPKGTPPETNSGSGLRTTDLLGIAASFWPERPAIQFGDESVTYGQLLENSTRVAGGLKALGIGTGDRVAILAGNSPKHIELYFATALIGAQFVPLNFRSNPDQLAYMLNLTGSKLLFFDDRNQTRAKSAQELIDNSIQLVALEETDQEPNYQKLINEGRADQLENTAIDTDITIVMFTSGTTSLPKAVLQPHRSFTANIAFPDDVEGHEIILISTPLFHVAAMQGVFSSIAEGRTMVLLPDFRVESLLQALSHGVGRATLVPTQIEAIVNYHNLDQYDLSHLRTITYGGSSIPLAVIQKAVQLLPHVDFYRAYGLTETGGTVAVLGPQDHRTDNQKRDELEKKIYRLTYSVGKPLHGVEIIIVDESGNLIPARDQQTGPLGRIAIKSNQTMQGYLGREAETQAVLQNKVLTTQDIGWQDTEGYVYCLARADDMIIRGGEKIPPAEVETIIASHPAVLETAVVGLPDRKWGQIIAAVVVAKPGLQIDEAEILALCKERLGSSKTPDKIAIITTQLPRNAADKILRSELQKLFDEIPS